MAVLSMHTSPLAQPGSGDGGGMNVYVRELSSALALAGIDCDVYTRAFEPGLPDVVEVEPGFRVHNVVAGPLEAVPKEQLPELVPEFTEGVHRRMETAVDVPGLIHANYWLSGVAGHSLKHDLGLPLVSTFHTLARVKAETCGDEPEQRARAEAQVIGCSDAILASTGEEQAQLERLYEARSERIEIVSPGVDHRVFSPGPRAASRAVLGLGDGPVLLFVGRIQPLKGADVAVRTLACLEEYPAATLVVVGGPSGPDGDAELCRLHELVDVHDLGGRVRFVPAEPHDHLATYYRAADACLVPSRAESFGLVALEAAACGTPVVAAAVGGLRSLVDHGHTGFLVEGRDPAAYAAYVSELLDNPRLAAEMSRHAAADALGYRWSMTAARLRRLYADLEARQLVECS
ncbi:MAG: glycosyltransferase [Acidimicrobiia bacterium]|nr:glycosyltransferase [Acidimicrobiia bacterium]MBV9041867.1 glycosyltransferase [Acidimicrobiia bacterium]MBV9285569.1 glycosyltransferase [Acidimicrobiia bacterium]